MISSKLISLTSNSVFIDSNIFIYSVGQDSPLKSICQDILTALDNNQFDGVVSVEIWQELLYYFQKLPKFFPTIDLFFSLPVSVLPVNQKIVVRGYNLMQQHKSLASRDALHIATMEEFDLQTILSADKDFDRIKTINRIDPISFLKNF